MTEELLASSLQDLNGIDVKDSVASRFPMVLGIVSLSMSLAQSSRPRTGRMGSNHLCVI